MWGLEIWFGLSVRLVGLCIEEAVNGLLNVNRDI